MKNNKIFLRKKILISTTLSLHQNLKAVRLRVVLINVSFIITSVIQIIAKDNMSNNIKSRLTLFLKIIIIIIDIWKNKDVTL